MTPGYEPKTRDQKLFHLVEECGELLQAIGKAGRFGMSKCDPTNPASVTNAQTILDEMADVQKALNNFKPELLYFLENERCRYSKKSRR